jgi:hypothetical protein
VLGAVVSAQGIQGAVGIVGVHAVGREGSDTPVGLLGQEQCELSRFTWGDGVDQGARGVIDPAHIFRLGVGG